MSIKVLKDFLEEFSYLEDLDTRFKELNIYSKTKRRVKL